MLLYHHLENPFIIYIPKPDNDNKLLENYLS